MNDCTEGRLKSGDKVRRHVREQCVGGGVRQLTIGEIEFFQFRVRCCTLDLVEGLFDLGNALALSSKQCSCVFCE